MSNKAEILKTISTLQAVPRRLFAKLLKENVFYNLSGHRVQRISCKEITIGNTILRFNKSTNEKDLKYRVITMVLNTIQRLNKFGRKQGMQGLWLAGVGSSTTGYNRPTTYSYRPPSNGETGISEILWLVDGLIIVHIVWSEAQGQYCVHDYAFISTDNPVTEYRLWGCALFDRPNFR